MILFCGILLWAPPFKDNFRIEWFAYAITASLGITAIAAFSIVRKRLQRFIFKIDWRFFLVILKESYPYALIIFLMTVYTRIDGVMIKLMLENGKIEADIYASAYRLLDAANMFGFLFAGLLLPMFSRMIKAGQAINELTRISFQFIMVGAISLVVGVVLFRGEIMISMYTDGSVYSGDILGFLILSFIAISSTYIYGSLLTANGTLMKMNVIFFAGVILNVILNLSLIPTQKALGAAFSTCITQWLVSLALILLAYREIPLRVPVKMIAKLLVFIILLLASAYSIFQFIDLLWIVKFLLIIMSGLLLAFVFKLFPTFAQISKWREGSENIEQ